MGFEKRMSKGDGSPSFPRKPTVSIPQWTNTAQPCTAAWSRSVSTLGSWIEYRCMAGKRHMASRPPATAAFSARGLTIANARNRGCAARAAVTDASSPGTLAIRAAWDTPYPSSSAAQTCASSAGSSAGRCQPSGSATSCTLLPHWAASDSKNRREKKCACASETAISPHGVCIRFVPVGDSRGPGQLRQASHVVHPELFHHSLAVTPHSLQAQIEHDRDILAGLAFGHQPQHLKLARRERFERSEEHTSE